MSPELIAGIRRSLCNVMEELGGVNVRLREIEQRDAFPDAAENIITYVDNAASELSACGRVIANRIAEEEESE